MDLRSDLASLFCILGGKSGHLTVRAVFGSELIAAIALVGAAFVVALIERRRLFDFNLTGPKRTANFFSGLAAGFLALSALVGGLWSGGWLHFGPVSLSGTALPNTRRSGALRFCSSDFLKKALFRCYLQFTLTRGINFWWALGILAIVCLSLVLRTKGSAAWGIYAIALLGVIPCLMLHLKRSPHSSFWQAAWVTSTLFGYIHVGNSGENWIGIFAAAGNRLRFLRERVAYRFGMVGHRLSRRLGLGRNLLLWNRR